VERKIEIDTQAIEGKLHEYQPIEIVNVNRTELESLWDEIVRKYHYLGYEKMIGQRIKYLVLYLNTPIAAISYNRASLRVGVRDVFIGWKEEQKSTKLPQIVNNNRFVILPWVRIKNLASYLLSRTLKLLRKDWYELYNTIPFLVETFVDNEKYKGTCYLAANWIYLGTTKGFGKIGHTFVYHGNRKGVYIYILQRKEFKLIQDESKRIKEESCHRALNTVNRGVLKMMLQKPDWSPTILEEAGITEQTVANLGCELADYLEPFRACINYSGQEVYTEIFVKGFLSDLPYKSAEPIALRYDKSVRGAQRFLKDGHWDTEKMADIYQAKLSGAITDKNAMITIDESGIPKKGVHSVGVARQYCGSTGKTDNCQVGVFVGYSSVNGYGLIDRQLYIPKKWFDDGHEQYRESCGIPEDVVFKTKIKIASEMLQKTVSSGLFPARWVGVDSIYGSNKDFLASIPKSLWYFADTHSNSLVFRQMPAMNIPEYSGKGRKDLKPAPSIPPVSVASIADDSSILWNKVVLGEGSKGPIISYEKCIRVIVCDENAPGETVWLYIRRFEDGSYKFSFCNAPWDTSLFTIREAALMRWPIEQCFEECKNELGLDQYEARSWNAWYRHTLLVFIAHLFLTLLRLKYKKKIPF
jgi:SRSO17 transposase